ncbi:MAG TPA: circadian clock KaiB family protein [Gemmatimonadaceae bacterium]|nr:circadian clock KaiB family protein [Gemmatimonadaceae bacterium]
MTEGNDETLSLRLYVAGDAPNSSEAKANLTALLEARVRGRYQLEIVDFLCEPQRAFSDGVFVTPTLVRLRPPPIRKIIGTLREAPALASALGIPESAGAK